MLKTEAVNKLISMGQEALTDRVDLISDQIEAIDPLLFKKQRKLLKSPDLRRNFVIYNDYGIAGSSADQALGEKLIAEGEMGCLLLAGGQGTRLGFEGPKGAFPVFNNKSLFQLFAERTLKASRFANLPLPLAIMTSTENDAQTREFWEKHYYFGLEKEQIHFFVQQNLPLLDEQGNLFMESPNRLAMGPDGNGSALKQFCSVGLWDKWKHMGVQTLNIILVDNALAQPFDPELLGYHERLAADVTVKCAKRISPEEKVGVLVKENGHVSVVEYSELGTHKQGDYCANLSMYCMDMDFIKKISAVNLPLHKAHKAVKYYDSEAKEVKIPSKSNAWKCEYFIFDALPFAHKVEALLYPREDCFAPLKNRNGDNSPATVKEALQDYYKRLYEKITGSPAPTGTFELPSDLIQSPGMG